jgi:hypothetical protein
MKTDGAPKTKVISNLAVGILFLAVGISMSTENDSSALIFLILGLFFLTQAFTRMGGKIKRHGEPPPRPAEKPTVQVNDDTIGQRREELRGLMESGIIDGDEYRDRMRALKP